MNVFQGGRIIARTVKVSFKHLVINKIVINFLQLQQQKKINKVKMTVNLQQMKTEVRITVELQMTAELQKTLEEQQMTAEVQKTVEVQLMKAEMQITVQVQKKAEMKKTLLVQQLKTKVHKTVEMQSMKAALQKHVTQKLKIAVKVQTNAILKLKIVKQIVILRIQVAWPAVTMLIKNVLQMLFAKKKMTTMLVWEFKQKVQRRKQFRTKKEQMK